MKDFIEKNSIYFLALILFIALFMRLYAFKNTYMVNIDGVLYINQARAIFSGDWELARNCGYNFISLYHVLIPAFYSIFGDWVISARAVSILFGTITTIPLYLTIRLFFNASLALLTTLIFAMSPFFVPKSVMIIKDATFWFFSFMGIFFFLAALVKKKDYYLAFASFFYLIASLSRIEAIIYLAGSFLYLFVSKEKMEKKLFIFILPVMISIMLSTLFLFHRDINIWDVYLQPRISFLMYRLPEQLFDSNFLQKSVYALEELSSDLLKLIYLPFLPLLIAGFFVFRQENKKNPHLSFLILLLILSAFALYIYHLKHGFLSSRYTSLAMLPAFVFISLGMKGFISFLNRKGLMQRTIIGFLFFYIIMVTLPPNLAHRSLKELIYKEIGEYIARIEKNQNVKILAPDRRVMFYANLHSPNIECTTFLPKYDLIKNMNYLEFVKLLKEKEIKYFLWQDKKWKDISYDFLLTATKEDFKEVDNWEDTYQGKLILFEIKNN